MKKTFTLISFFFVAIAMMANPVGVNEARSKAAAFLKHTSSAQMRAKSNGSSKMSLQEVNAGFDHLYVFNLADNGGFVVVSADDKTDAVLAYSESGAFDGNQGSGALKAMLTGLDGEVASVASSSFFTARNETAYKEQDREPVSPMITTCWYQYDPYYHFCPTDPESGRTTLVGCVAVTLAQIMNYYKYPEQTTLTIPGYSVWNGLEMPALPPTTFNYDLMLDHYAWDVFDPDYTPEQLAEVQKLLKYAGCALEMQYSSSGSASTFDVARIAKYFGYRSDARVLSAGQYPRTTWEQMVYNELAAGRPVPYNAGAVMAQNHSFIIDGYDGRGYFHAVTGELGNYGSNFYCKLHVINDCELQLGPVKFSGYNMYQSAVFGFQPTTSSQTLQSFTNGENMEGKKSKLEVDGVEFYNPYVGQKTVAVINHRNVGETYENSLFLWQGDELMGGAGSYVGPGQDGDVVVCFATPEESGTYPVRITSDWDGNDVLYETTLTVTPAHIVELQVDATIEGYKGYIWKNAIKEGYDHNYWAWDNTWTHDQGIYESLKVEADIKNVGTENYNSWLEVYLNESDQNEAGEAVYNTSISKVSHIYYLNLDPGETKHYTFFFDKDQFNPNKLYHFSLDYNRYRQYSALLTTPGGYSHYFASYPTNSIGVVEQQEEGTGDGPIFNLQGMSLDGKRLRPGIYIRGGKKVLVTP